MHFAKRVLGRARNEPLRKSGVFLPPAQRSLGCGPLTPDPIRLNMRTQPSWESASSREMGEARQSWAGLVADAAPRPRQTGTNRIGPVKSQANMVEVVNSLAGMVVGTNAGVEGHRRGRNPPVQLHRALLFVLALAGFSGDSGGSVIPYNLDWSAEREGLRGDGLHEMSRNHGLRRTSSILIDGTCQGPAVAGSYRPFSTGALRDTALSAQRESCCHIRGAAQGRRTWENEEGTSAQTCDCKVSFSSPRHIPNFLDNVIPLLGAGGGADRARSSRELHGRVEANPAPESSGSHPISASSSALSFFTCAFPPACSILSCFAGRKAVLLRPRADCGMFSRATEHGHCDTVELLVARGAVIGMGDERASQAMHYAAYNGHTHVVEVRFKLEAARKEGGRAPHRSSIAEARGGTDVAHVGEQVLARLGAAVNDKNKFGYSPLQYASADGRLHT
eukprot:1276255-Rhodomonas_salina.3